MEGAASVRMVRPTGAGIDRQRRQLVFGDVGRHDSFRDDPDRIAFAHKGTAEGIRHGLDLVGHPAMPLVMRKLDERANDGRAGRHQHRISIEPGKDRSLGQQRMTGAYAEYHLFRIEMLEGKTRHFFRRRKSPHNKIVIADAQLFQQHRSRH